MSFSVLSIVNRVKLRKPLKEPHPSHSFLSDFILGSQDGLVNVLGILLGISAATGDVRIIFVGALAALGAEVDLDGGGGLPPNSRKCGVF